MTMSAQQQVSTKEHFQALVDALVPACQTHYGGRLVSLAIFGSVARGTMRPDSDIDVLVVAESLPRGRIPRVKDFAFVEEALSAELSARAQAGIHTSLSPVMKTREEVRYGSPLFLDMTDQARILYDRDNFLRDYLADLAQRLKAMGARRVYSHGGYYWVLKPDLKPGEKIVI